MPFAFSPFLRMAFLCALNLQGGDSMIWQTILAAVTAFAGGSGFTKLLEWLRNRDKNAATVRAKLIDAETASMQTIMNIVEDLRRGVQRAEETSREYEKRYVKLIESNAIISARVIALEGAIAELETENRALRDHVKNLEARATPKLLSDYPHEGGKAGQ